MRVSSQMAPRIVMIARVAPTAWRRMQMATLGVGANGRGQPGIGKETGIESIAPARAIYTDGATHSIVSIAAGTQHSLKCLNSIIPVRSR